ncbi:hypothetical protein GCM10009030_39020 [Haloarcula pellucida]|uniref:Uncharacterized protein n=1 Tax=Haloarcula pellucida TaxID=1427151 RepID=A0A830GSS2_9EURY|nr:hypothetical protein GCM10009030_39020 [Halomicroarcula pellucida]
MPGKARLRLSTAIAAVPGGLGLAITAVAHGGSLGFGPTITAIAAVAAVAATACEGDDTCQSGRSNEAPSGGFPRRVF